MAVLEALRSSEAVVASHWGLEVANGLMVAERRGRVSAAEAHRQASVLLALPIAVDPMSRARPLESVRRLGRAHELTSYDAAYLELAVRYGIPIATLDDQLRAAAVEEGVTIFGASPETPGGPDP
jgi:predicted nucleic acid-binding protein